MSDKNILEVDSCTNIAQTDKLLVNQKMALKQVELSKIVQLILETIGESGGIAEETDPTVPAWAKKPEKPSYTANEVGARPSTWTPTAIEVGADSAGTAVNKVNTHNTSNTAHNDIRSLITNLSTQLNSLLDSDDMTLDQLSEIIAYIKNNKSLIDSVTTSKANKSDIVNNLTTNVSTKMLSAAQGVALKGMIPSVDASLTKQGAAADAKATGDNFRSQKTLIDEKVSLNQGIAYANKFLGIDTYGMVSPMNVSGSQSIIPLWQGESQVTSEISLPAKCIRATNNDIFNIGRVLLIVNGYYIKKEYNKRKMIPYSTPSGANTYNECIEHNMSTILGINIGKTDWISSGQESVPGFGIYGMREYTVGQKLGHYTAYSSTDFAMSGVLGQTSCVMASIVFKSGNNASLIVWSDGESIDNDCFTITEVLAIC